MTKVVGDITMSLDGYVTGPNAGPANGLGDGGVPMHAWVESDDPVDTAVLEAATTRSGAVIMGRRLFDVVDGPHGWTAERGYGAGFAADPPFFVVTHEAPASSRLALEVGLDVTMVTDGLPSAVAQARAAAGAEDVVIMGGGEVIRRALDEGLVEELRIHLAPIVMGSGTPLFDTGPWTELIQRDVRISPTATHLTYEVRNR